MDTLTEKESITMKDTRYVLGDWYVDKGSAIKLEDGLDFIEIN